MKKLLFSLFALGLCLCSNAQATSGYIVLDTEKIYKSIARYNQAVISLENLADKYQKEVDAAYQAVKTQFEQYQAVKAQLSQSERSRREAAIIANEKKISTLQESYFGEEGAMEKKKAELLDPIQEMVSTIISSYAKSNGYNLVLEKNSEASILYVSPSVDKTEQIVKMLNQ